MRTLGLKNKTIYWQKDHVYKLKPHERCWCPAGSCKSLRCRFHVLPAGFVPNILFLLKCHCTGRAGKWPTKQIPEGIKQLCTEKIWKISNHKRDTAKRRKIPQMPSCPVYEPQVLCHWCAAMQACMPRKWICTNIWQAHTLNHKYATEDKPAWLWSQVSRLSKRFLAYRDPNVPGVCVWCRIFNASCKKCWHQGFPQV